MSDKDNIILFPLNKIKDKAAAMAADPKQHKKIVDEQTKEFVEGNVDEIQQSELKPDDSMEKQQLIKTIYTNNSNIFTIWLL